VRVTIVPNGYMVAKEKLLTSNGAELFRIDDGVGRRKFNEKWWCLGKA
jgi:hypothetical protein